MALTFDLSTPKRLLRAAGEVGCIQCFQYSQGMGHRLPDVQQPPHRTTGLLLGLHSYRHLLRMRGTYRRSSRARLAVVAPGTLCPRKKELM